MQQLNFSIARTLLDAFLVVLSCSIAYFLRFGDFVMPSSYQMPTLILVLSTYLSFSFNGRYWRTNQPQINRYNNIFSGLLLSSLFTSMFLYLTQSGDLFSRTWFLLTIITMATLICFIEFALSQLMHRSNTCKRIIVIGNNQTANRIMKVFNHQSNNIVAVKQFGISHTNIPPDCRSIFKDALAFIEAIRSDTNQSEGIAEAWITHDIYSSETPHRIDTAFENSATGTVYVAELPEGIPIETSTLSAVAGFNTVNSSLGANHRFNSLVKYTIDKTVSAILLILLIPLFILIAILIKLDSKGPIFYKQKRYGVSGKEFLIWKFRTMTVLEEESEFKQARKGDARITTVGRILRKSSLDEIPQLLNVILGSMSLVGPRPHPNMMNQEYRLQLDNYMNRHNVRPGITGLAQIRGFRGETNTVVDMKNRLSSDLEYINTWSIMLDLKILLLTVGHLIKNDSAH